ncbi:protein FAM114A2 [Cotesia typhae]|uniref:protein FAM114A2 n=1 Tax=Cotesia typhae TaxID=2053667 RepID=UPI003D68FF35
MATSDSDNFESADEEIEFRDVLPQKSSPEWVANSTISSDSDDDVCVTSVKQNSWSSKINNKNYDNLTDADDTSNVYNTQHSKTGQESKQRTASIESSSVSNPSLPKSLTDDNQQKGSISNQQQIVTDVETDIVDNIVEKLNKTEINKCDTVIKDASLDKVNNILSQVYELDNTDKKISKNSDKRDNTQIQEKSKESSKSKSSGVKKLGSRIGSYNTKRVTKEVDFSNVESKKFEKDRKIFSNQECFELDDDGATKILERESSNNFPANSWHKSTGKSSIDELDEVPPELKSNKKFKEVFGAGDWQDLGDQDEIINEFDTENLKPVLDKLTTTTSEEKTNVASGGWGSWGNWGVTTLLNTASVGVSNLTSQVSYGLSVLEESINAPSTTDHEQKQTLNEKSVENTEDSTEQMSLNFSNLISGVSSITKLVENTGTKVINTGLGTLETIGKKTMEVLQEGDPGLKKKRAFFMNESNKPILSHILKEAKEKALNDQKTFEEKEQAKKVHFESLFDDFQGLIHLEALEMLSKQSDMNIQQRLISLNAEEAISIQETLDEIKELCDLGDENDHEKNDNDNLEEKLKALCADLNIILSFDELFKIRKETQNYITNISQPESTVSDREIFQNAISNLAQFTAYCMERFHKTAELILIKDRRSTVNEADALVQLTVLLSQQIGVISNLFCKCLNERAQKSEKSNDSVDITTIFLEATNATSYIKEAFQLFIPILQVGAI